MQNETPHYKEMIKLFESMRYKYDLYTVFEDFLYMAGAALSNPYDFVHAEKREAEYMKRVTKYGKDAEVFAKILGELIMCLQDGPNDYLGRVFMELNISNKWRGQFFTPYSVAHLMASITLTKENIERSLKQHGYISIGEPCCGGGVNIIAAFNVIKALGYNPQEIMRVQSQDIDMRSVLMTFIQTTLLGIENTVILGNTLTLEVKDVWRTSGSFLRILDQISVKSQVLHKRITQDDITSELLDEIEDIHLIEEDNGQFALF